MQDAIGTLRLTLTGPPEHAPRARDAALVARAAATAVRVPSASDPGERVLLVRRLSVHLPIPNAAGPEALAAAAGRQLESAVRGSLARSASNLDVLTFDSTAEYVAHFVEQCLRGRALDAWHLQPLAGCIAPTIPETIRRLAEAEPEAWAAALALLRSRRLLPLLLRHLSSQDHGVLFGSAKPRRELGPDEARPLFLVAWRVVAAFLGHRPADAAPMPGGSPESAASRSMDAELREFLATGLEAPTTWSDRGALGTTVAAMVTWLLARTTGSGDDLPAATAVLARLSWIETAPVRAALVRPNPRLPAATPVPPIRPAGNRAQALRFLAAAGLPQGSAPERRVLDELVGQLLHRGAGSNLDAIEAALLGQASDHTGSPPTGSSVAALLPSARSLTRVELRSLATALSTEVEAALELGVPTGAAGVFLLVRPLVDLRLHLVAGGTPEALRGLVRGIGRLAAGRDDVAAAVLATGNLTDEPPSSWPPPAEVEQVFRDQLRHRASVLRLEPLDAPASVPALGLAIACRQLVRWLHGFEESSTRFVLDRMVRVPGYVRVPPRGPVSVRWPGSGFDVLLERAGYLSPMDAVPWWPCRGLAWRR